MLYLNLIMLAKYIQDISKLAYEVQGLYCIFSYIH